MGDADGGRWPRDERGVGVIEYVGVVALVALLGSALFAMSSPLGGQAGAAVQRAVCSVGAGVGLTDCDPGTPEPEPVPPVLDGPVDEAIAELARRLGVPVDEIDVARVENVYWSDGSIGCARPGGHYTQAIEPGKRIILVAGGQEYHFHSGRSGVPFHCANPTQ